MSDGADGKKRDHVCAACERSDAMAAAQAYLESTYGTPRFRAPVAGHIRTLIDIIEHLAEFYDVACDSPRYPRNLRGGLVE